jgi:hypothetical protein
MNFSRGKLRISITFRGTQGILSKIYQMRSNKVIMNEDICK